ncbi:MAG: 23S rRNA (uracil(1939)-C(5))-methyltransferase RlmD, partial [Eubacterium sp.]|nr:23S rRNA (uracil(1939)-C(5))-methyltransferase RlmD [Eubacterium sp.]
MKKGQIIEGKIEKIEFPNKGIMYLEEKPLVIKNALPGQIVKCAVQKIRHGKGEARLLEVLEKSPIELETPACIHFGECGGCLYQSISYETQLKIKEHQVLGLIVPVVEKYQPSGNNGQESKVPDWFAGMIESPMRKEYRNKMEFSFGDAVKGGELMLGMHKRGSFHDIVAVHGCQIADEDFRVVLGTTLDFFREKEVPFYHKMSREGVLRHLLVRKGIHTKEILIDLITTTQDKDLSVLLKEYTERLLKLSLRGKIAGILHTENDSMADAVINENTELLYGREFFYEDLSGLKFKITPFSFFQTNSAGAEKLYGAVRDFIGELKGREGHIVYDLYSGTGTIAQMISSSADQVIGVEIVEEAVEAARENAALNGITNCRFIAGDVLKVLDNIEEKPDFIILDPPREGIHPKAIRQIISYGVERMVYISCKPTSLKRDLEILLEAGYCVQKMCCVDMFPGTANVETVVMLSHKKPDSVINVKVEFGEGEGKVPLDNI